jgi:NAD(P)-dependent dehydrogenase (short-subunit alcohol dehydrogenase family)
VSSLAGVHGTKGAAPYSAAKAALQMFTRVAAAEWGPHGIRINCVAPGMILSDITEEHLRSSNIDMAAGIANFPLRRAGKPEDVANAIAFLASDAASYITGETLGVGGGPVLGGPRDL